uniref:Hflx-type G domain-containing protein n=1 Tax=Romanomermis culicivorax TaxID=13658 RepID=A0A915J1R8_ROMCU
MIGAHSVLVLQPKVVWGSKKPSDTSAELMLEESCALVRTLPDWRVSACELVSVKYEIDRSQVFGSGNLQKISCKVAGDASITAIFVNIDVLTPVQQTELSAAFRKPVYDRYQIVLTIFKTFAKSRLAKLHVAAAEMPYVAARLRELTIGAIPDTLNALDYLGGHGFKILEERADMFKKRESYLKKVLVQVRKTRERTHEQIRKNYPLVAVIGYTNSGKTSLVNCLTKSLREKEPENLQPKDRLFATLDCAMFMGQLPISRIKAGFADTVGFVADIPASLIACFEATLDYIRHASLLIHVMDITHPDAKLQQITVHSTLKKMNLPSELLKNMIEVHNKVDKAGRIEVQSLSNTTLDVSCVTGTGIPRLQQEIDNIIKIVDKFITVRLKVPNGGEQL